MKGSSSLVLGIDEAGRGPVIGPLVICGVMLRKSRLDELTARGVKDSKLLSPSQRQTLKGEIESLAEGFELIIISPSQIDSCNMGDLELKGMVKLIKKFLPDQVFVDAPTSRPELYERRISSLLFSKRRVELVVENRADRTYPIVGAASILAKVERDRRVHLLEKKYGAMGSGYPSDPRTIDFLKSYFYIHGQFPGVVRKKWRTIHRLEQGELPKKRS